MSEDYDENQVVIPIDHAISDGTPDSWPSRDDGRQYRVKDDTNWKTGLADLWIEKTGAAEPGVTYTINKLPNGYRLFDRPRGTNPAMRDAFLFGHPSGVYYQSRTTFFLHFWWLMTDRESPCKCHICIRPSQAKLLPSKIEQSKQSEQSEMSEMSVVKQRRRRRTKLELLEAAKLEASRPRKPPGRPHRSESLAQPVVEASSRPKAKVEVAATRQKASVRPNLPSDDEGPDYWKIHIIKLKEKGTLDEKIKHSMNIDWVLTHEYLTDYFVKLQVQPAFIPRRGEIVLWVPFFTGTLEIKPGTDCWYKRSEKGIWLGEAEWRAGVVTQVPEEPSNYFDITRITKKDASSISSWGYRVETLPDPVADNKSISLQYAYLSLNFIKPFGSYEKVIRKMADSQRHPSIEHAMRTMASWSLLSHFRFSGTWPNAEIDSNGIFIGSDLIALKDTVRLKPPASYADALVLNPSEVDPIDVMIVERIWLDMKGCRSNPYDSLLADSVRPMLAGKVYTRDKDRLLRPMSFAQDPLERLTDKDMLNAFPQPDDGDWYRVAGGRTCVVSQVMVLGRCHEPTANNLHYGSSRLDYDLVGVVKGRKYSTLTDERIINSDCWFWGDNRVETLGLATMNGVEVGEAAEQRDSMKWQAILRIIKGLYTDADLKTAGLKTTSSIGRPRKQYSEVSKTSTLVGSIIGQVAATASEDSDLDMSESELLASIPFKKGAVDEHGQQAYCPHR